MKLKSISVSGFFGKAELVHYDFHEDLNIITGRNGSGKTTILKLAWMIISGNIYWALKEIDFKACKLVTSEYTCTVTKTASMYCRIELETSSGNSYLFEDDGPGSDYEYQESSEDQAAPYLIELGSSIFFPTFRRIEGGFSLDISRRTKSRAGNRPGDEIDDVLNSLSKKMSNDEHLFVAAISSQDINSILLQKFASLSEKINIFQADISRSVIEKIRQHQNSSTNSSDAETLLTETRKEIEKIETFRTESMRPLDAVRTLVETLFQHAGISFDRRLSFGDAAEAVKSDVLSAGEKQMLSFICYNAFHQDAIIFIDEPELSLHVDWQRQLYKILKKQNPSNQFIFATHSPFIYGKYPDKEVAVGVDRGE
ncbi:AAA family ATPase [uncultured Pantoea sp.]|uniref:AAA family ATPase n=1 Tax=uncultured Pantoea sp. TaxID=218084 RepID=UPI002804D613|nr:AAA family ATPase [uncultured Pantoea sp.]